MNIKHYADFEKEANKYSEILENYKTKGEVFTDPNFHPICKIKETTVKFIDKEHMWERIDKYYTAPLFKKELISPEAIIQGELRSSYFIASLSRIAQQPEIVELLFDTRTKSEPESTEEDFIDTINLKCGAVIVYFHAFGRPTPVLIDTLVPFIRGTRKPRFSRPSDLKYSPWFCLVEKAYAKLCGSYSFIECGQISSAIYNLFGYFPYYSRFSDVLSKREEKLRKIEGTKSDTPQSFNRVEYLFSKIMMWQYQNAVIGAEIQVKNLPKSMKEEEIIDKGLMAGHSYLIVKARREQGQNFICLMNPLDDHEWLGDWSDTSPLWTREMKAALGFRKGNDGTFWMADKDFFKYFSNFDVAKPNDPDFFSRSFMASLCPCKSDGRPLRSKDADLGRHQTFVVKLKDVIFKSEDTTGSKGAVEDVKMYVRIERNLPFEQRNSRSEYAMYVIFSDGPKADFKQLPYCSRQLWTSDGMHLAASVHVNTSKPFIIVFHRLQKKKFTEELYVQVSCRHDFELYDIDKPAAIFPEDEKTPVLLSNTSRRYRSIAREVCVREVSGKEMLAFQFAETKKLSRSFYRHLEPDKKDDGDDGFIEYDVSDDENAGGEKKEADEGAPNPGELEEASVQTEEEKVSDEKEIEMQKELIKEEKRKLELEKEKIAELQKEMAIFEEERKKITDIQKEWEKIEEEKKKIEEEKKNIEDEKSKLEYKMKICDPGKDFESRDKKAEYITIYVSDINQKKQAAQLVAKSTQVSDAEDAHAYCDYDYGYGYRYDYDEYSYTDVSGHRKQEQQLAQGGRQRERERRAKPGRSPHDGTGEHSQAARKACAMQDAPQQKKAQKHDRALPASQGTTREAQKAGKASSQRGRNAREERVVDERQRQLGGSYKRPKIDQYSEFEHEQRRQGGSGRRERHRASPGARTASKAGHSGRRRAEHDSDYYDQISYENEVIQNEPDSIYEDYEYEYVEQSSQPPRQRAARQPDSPSSSLPAKKRNSGKSHGKGVSQPAVRKKAQSDIDAYEVKTKPKKSGKKPQKPVKKR